MGCSRTCVYCFARRTHSCLDLDTGLGFDSQIVVKVNAPELLRRRLSSRSWQGEHIAMGTNVDCYQRAEGRYRLMPGILAALRDHANPFSILTKGTLILRDLPLLRQAAEVTDVGVSVSVGFTDETPWHAVEPGTPAPERRLDVVRALAGQGIGCGVLMAPVTPFLSDRPDQLRATVRAVAGAGATSVTHWCCICGPAPASGSCPGWNGTIRTWSPATHGCTRRGRTRRSGTSAGSPVRCTSWPGSTASARPARACPGGSGRPRSRILPGPPGSRGPSRPS